jgi:Calcineurin-like phosphoesterase
MKRLASLAAGLALLASAPGCGSEDGGATFSAPEPAPPGRAAGVEGPTLAAAGDIACPRGLGRNATRCRSGDTARVIERLDPDVVAALGDIQYDRGTRQEYRTGAFDPTWGRFKSRIRPAAGNHEYGAGGSTAGYRAYFGARGGPFGRYWYSYDLGGWHVVVLNSNCRFVGCRTGGAQERWLRADLARNQAECTLAYWHHPRFSSGLHGSDPTVAPLWRTLERAGADVVLSAHDHSYERFGPQTSTGRASREGMVQFVVGTGGVNNYPIIRARPNSRLRRSFVFGVLELTLGEGAYSWRFVPVPGLTFTDRGSGRCR